MTLADQIAHELDRSPMTKTAVAKAAGISRWHLSMLASGKRGASPAMLQRIANVLGVSFALVVRPQPPP